MRKVDGTWIAFLAMAFAVVGLTGLFATFAAPLPLQRAVARDAALDAALVAASGPDAAAALEQLRPRLGDSADALLPPQGDMAARIAQERLAMHQRLLAEAEATAIRLRWLICIATVMAAVFGAAIVGVSARKTGPSEPAER
ncbi:hypothetical protein [Limobrevibacterium gyesilva]|uniref:Uncharacterized protein n=1 Tax=Limobrevibacterium gyesilva TaxID=2991712 RepID=A0AA41YY75_9PROT|nr:hypothetical protein [Limobrevibacterium gyesilva]MCW3477447.1 hypothetical protein [Limobrevibacterium gyesilva]